MKIKIFKIIEVVDPNHHRELSVHSNYHAAVVERCNIILDNIIRNQHDPTYQPNKIYISEE